MNLREALEVVDRAADQAGRCSGAGASVVEAMRFLRDYGVERAALVWFWKSLQGSNEIGRSQNANAARNRIRALLHALHNLPVRQGQMRNAPPSDRRPSPEKTAPKTELQSR